MVKPVLKSIALVANGSIENYDKMREKIKVCDEIIAVDGGLHHCKMMHVQPSLIIGDFDSTPKGLMAEFSGIPIKQFSTHKDETDLELAIAHALSLNPEKIILFGVLGKRLDHTLANLYLLIRDPEKIVIESDYETVTAITESRKYSSVPGQLFSLMALGSDVQDVTTQGLKWELEGVTINPYFFSQSNEALGNEVSIRVGEGVLLCMTPGSIVK